MHVHCIKVVDRTLSHSPLKL